MHIIDSTSYGDMMAGGAHVGRVGGSWRMRENYGGYDQEHCMHVWNCQSFFFFVKLKKTLGRHDLAW